MAEATIQPEALPELAAAHVFQGFNVFSGQAGQTALGGALETFNARTRCDYTICTDFQSVLTALDVSASVGYSNPAFSASAKVEYASKLKISSYTVTVVLYANLIKGTQQPIGSVTLNADVQPPHDQASLKQFILTYGDSWVGSIVSGAEYYATYRFYAESAEEQQEIVTSLNASGISTGGSISVAAQASLEQQASRSSTRAAFSQEAQGISGVPLPTQDQLADWVLHTFPTLKLEAPAIIDFDLVGYETVGGLGNMFAQQVAATRRQFDGTTTGHPQNLSQQLMSLQECRDAIRVIKDVYRQYGYTGDTVLAGRALTVGNDLTALNALINEMSLDPTHPYDWPTLPSLAFGTPSLNVALVSSDTFGGYEHPGYGTPFADLESAPRPGFVELGWVISKLTLSGGLYVDSITVEYRNLDGDVVPIKHGGTGGSPSQPLTLAPGEFVSEIDANYGWYVNKLTIKTTKGQTLGPYPPRAQVGPISGQYNPPTTTYTVPIGFSGRAGWYIDELIVNGAAFSPAVWSGSG